MVVVGCRRVDADGEDHERFASLASIRSGSRTGASIATRSVRSAGEQRRWHRRICGDFIRLQRSSIRKLVAADADVGGELKRGFDVVQQVVVENRISSEQLAMFAGQDTGDVRLGILLLILPASRVSLAGAGAKQGGRGIAGSAYYGGTNSRVENGQILIIHFASAGDSGARCDSGSSSYPAASRSFHCSGGRQVNPQGMLWLGPSEGRSPAISAIRKVLAGQSELSSR